MIDPTPERQKDYGHPKENFARTAAFWSTYKGIQFSPEDVAAMMVLLKVARLIHNPRHTDGWVDIGGYAKCGLEVVK